MKTTTWKSAGICFTIVAILTLMGGVPGEAQYWSSSGLGARSFCSPSLIEFTGTVYSPDEESAAVESGDVFDLVIKSKKTWVFAVEDARNRSCTETKLGILKDLFPRILYLGGEKEQIAFLQNPAIAGEPIIVQGYLYRDSRKLTVTKAEAVTRE